MGWPENTAFSATLPTLQLAWDSTSLGDLKKCARYYELRMIHGWQTRTRSVDLDFGIWLHSGRERYYHARAAQKSHEDALNDALQYVLCATWDQRTDRPWQGDQYKNRYTLARTLVWYLDQWEHDPLQTVILGNGKPAVEVSFRFGLGLRPLYAQNYDPATDKGGESDDEFSLCGHLDRIVSFQSRTWGSDLKSTRHTLDQQYFAQFSPDNQMSVYSIAGRVVLKDKIAGMIIDACQVAVGFSRFGRAFVERTESQLNEFMRGLQSWLRYAEQCAKDNFWPMNEKACFRCEFRGICNKSPAVREQWLKADFVKRVWDPLKTRGDI